MVLILNRRTLIRLQRYTNRTEGCSNRTIKSALHNNHTDIVNFLKQQYFQYGQYFN